MKSSTLGRRCAKKIEMGQSPDRYDRAISWNPQSVLGFALINDPAGDQIGVTWPISRSTQALVPPDWPAAEQSESSRGKSFPADGPHSGICRCTGRSVDYLRYP